MKWTIRLGRIFGIEVRVHATFAILLAWIAGGLYLEGHSLGSALGGILFVLAVFSIVVLHELGHALTAKRFGIATRDITLLPIGGVSRMERMPEDPRQELLVSLAGPAVNVALALLLFGLAIAFPALGGLGPTRTGAGLFTGSVLARLIGINVVLAAFNLIPAFPMDGGRVLRALLASRMPAAQATAIAARLGQAIALLFGALGLFLNPLLVFIALFVWVGATQEESASELRDAIHGLPVEAAMIRDVRSVSPRDPLREAVRHVLEGFQHDFPVVDDDRVVGILTRAGLVKGLAGSGPEASVSQVMEKVGATTEPSEPLAGALQRLRESASQVLPVLDGGRLVGVLTMENVSELVLVRTALRSHSTPTAA